VKNSIAMVMLSAANLYMHRGDNYDIKLGTSDFHMFTLFPSNYTVSVLLYDTLFMHA